MLKKFFVLIFLFSIITAESFLAYHFYQNPQSSDITVTKTIDLYSSSKIPLDFEVDAIRAVQKSPKNVNDIFMTGWIPDWDIPDGLETLKKNPGKFDSVSPVWFFVNNDGSLKRTAYTNGSALISYVKQNNIDLIPTISLFKRDIFSDVLNNEANYNRHINEIMHNVTTYNYDGIDIDYEEVYLKDKYLFFKFMKELSEKLHAKGKQLIVSPLSKWGDEIEYIGTKMVYDYKRLADYVDEIRIQGYGYTFAGNDEISPIGPLVWLEDVVRYAIKIGVPREKLVLGVHTYAYDWSERPIVETLNYYNHGEVRLPIEGLPDADAYYYASVQNVIAKYNMSQEFKEDWGEVLGRYTFQGKPRFVVFPNDRSIELRKQLASDYGIKGIAYWRLGDEGNLKL